MAPFVVPDKSDYCYCFRPWSAESPFLMQQRLEKSDYVLSILRLRLTFHGRDEKNFFFQKRKFSPSLGERKKISFDIWLKTRNTWMVQIILLWLFLNRNTYKWLSTPPIFAQKAQIDNKAKVYMHTSIYEHGYVLLYNFLDDLCKTLITSKSHNG